MKKLSILLLAVFLISFSANTAEAADVTFQVDMSVQIMKGNFDPLTQKVRVTGDLVDPNWDPAQAPILADEDSNYVYTTTLQIAAGSYAYKYLIGSAWGNDELQGQPNRSLTVGAENMVIDPVYFDNLSEITFDPAPAGKVNLMLSVNMTRQDQIGQFDPQTDTVRVTGNLVDSIWTPAEAPILEDPDSNMVYVTTLQVDNNSSYEYKYLIGSAWGRDELQGQPNRSLTVVEIDTVLFPVYFDNDPYIPPTGGDSVNVTLQINMRVKILESKFDPTTDVVRAAGSFQGWDPTTSPDMLDPEGDSIYVYTYKMTEQTTHIYKFLIGTDWGNDEANNRELEVGSNDMVVSVVYFDDDSVVTETADGNILFTAKMDVMNEIGIYDPVKDSLQVRGGFNGWGDSQPLRSKMEQYFLDENEWFLDVSFEDEGVGNDQAYKFYVVIADTATIWTDSWERPLSQGGGNRNIDFEGSATQEAPIAYYDDVHPDWVIESGVNVQAIFSVDMSPAMDPALQAVPFSPAADTVFWISGQPSFAASQGWVDSTVNRVLMLTDDNSDSVYTGTMTVNTPAFNAFEYRYAFWHAGSEWVYEPSGFSDFAYRVRYVGQDAARSFPVIPWSMPLDIWTNAEVKTDQETDPFTSYVGVDDEIMPVPTIYTLNQNYPNPFNPVTTITYTLAKSGKINLAVYNLLGQKVRTLVNSNATAGLHINKWNGLDDHGKKVASGIYFYKLEADNFTAVKKMIMLK